MSNPIGDSIAINLGIFSHHAWTQPGSAGGSSTSKSSIMRRLIACGTCNLGLWQNRTQAGQGSLVLETKCSRMGSATGSRRRQSIETNHGKKTNTRDQCDV